MRGPTIQQGALLLKPRGAAHSLRSRRALSWRRQLKTIQGRLCTLKYAFQLLGSKTWSCLRRRGGS